MKTPADLLEWGADLLRRSNADSPSLSARLLLAHVLDCSLEKLLIVLDAPVGPEKSRRFVELVRRRSKGEPVAYILGRKEFFGLDFQVSADVLIPRPETEMIVDLVDMIFGPEDKAFFADIGTGSGVLSVCIAARFPLFQGFGCDISYKALHLARRNACTHGVQEKILFFASDMGEGIRAGSLDLIVCNPPYLSLNDYGRTGREVRDFEPELSLLSSADGLGHIRRLSITARRALRRKGVLLLEIGCGQAEEVKDIFYGWQEIKIHKDLAGRDRIIMAVNP